MDAIEYVPSLRCFAHDTDGDLRVLIPLRGTLRVELENEQQGRAGMVNGDRWFRSAHNGGLRALIFTMSTADLQRTGSRVLDLSHGPSAGPGRLAAERDHLDSAQFRLVCRQLTGC